eukprot:snap_masked-scaffold_28-processed-gene-3.21-mRNA-1 protein AED:1.00 eAED:1.00 QI:0/0/0/0/1/1/2/0/66
MAPLEDYSFYFPAISHNAEEIISDVNGLNERLTTLGFIIVVRRQWNDLLQIFQDQSFRFANSYIFY